MKGDNKMNSITDYNKSLDFIKSNLNTNHIIVDRLIRLNMVEQIGKGKIVKAFRCDFGHRNGAEIHVIYENSIIEIYNENTQRHITTLIARPQQIRRYFEATNELTPNYLIKNVVTHVQMGLNEI